MHRSRIRLVVLPTVLAALSYLLPASHAAAATFVVNSTSDAAPAGDSNPGDGVCEDERSGNRCTLRAAIEEANALAGVDTIAFSVTGTIILQGTALPAITDAVILDGRTAPGYVNTGNVGTSPPKITVDGTLLGGSPWGISVRNAAASVSDVLALSVVGFAGGGIRALNNADNLWIQGCYVGIRPGGLAAGNGTGVSLLGEGHLVGQLGLPGAGSGIGNIISGNTGVGLLVLGGDNLIRGNRIGTSDGGNGGDGIQLIGSGNWIGDGGTGSNVVTRNGGDGIRLLGDDNRILGNDVGGFSPIVDGNGEHGIVVFGDDNIIGSDAPGGRNLVRGNALNGIQLGSDATAADRTAVRGNLLADNGGYGILVFNGTHNRIHANHVIGNNNDGIRVLAATDTVITANRIGYTTIAGGTTAASPNGGSGINVSGDRSRVGFDRQDGTVLAQPNEVGFSADEGIVLAGASSEASYNYVGVRLNGDAMANDGNGIRLLGGAPNTGLKATRNTVFHSGESGIAVHSTNALVCGNTLAFSALDGLWLSGNDNLVGRDDAGCPGNIIGLNDRSGIRVTGASNTIRGNGIGVADDLSAISNLGDGIWLNNSGVFGSHIVDNYIGFNGGDGIGGSTGGNGNRIDDVKFIGNVGDPIDLGPNGPTPNDPQDADLGPNRLQNHPLIESASLAGNVMQLAWWVDSAADHASYPLLVDIYFDKGDGMVRLLGRYTYATPFALQTAGLELPPGATGGHLYAMATDAQGNSSELSPPRAVGLPSALFANGFE